jgi:hypothetical protein
MFSVLIHAIRNAKTPLKKAQENGEELPMVADE